jgi:hypothetical protein
MFEARSVIQLTFSAAYTHITSACPSGAVEIAVIKPSRTFRIPPENVHVRRKSDGTPVVISAEIP